MFLSVDNNNCTSIKFKLKIEKNIKIRIIACDISASYDS